MIKGIGEKHGINLEPTSSSDKENEVVTRNLLCQGTNTWYKYELRIHRRVIDWELTIDQSGTNEIKDS